jgi:hypothetical protein
VAAVAESRVDASGGERGCVKKKQDEGEKRQCGKFYYYHGKLRGLNVIRTGNALSCSSPIPTPTKGGLYHLTGTVITPVGDFGRDDLESVTGN